MVEKVAIDLSWIKIDKSGGVENHTLNLIKPLNKKNITFFVSPQLIKNKKYNWLKDCEKKVLTNFYYYNIFYVLFLSFFFLKKEKIKNFFSTNIYCPIIKNKKLKITITLHHAMWLIFPEYYSYLKRKFFDIYYKIIGNENSYIAISNHIKNIFKRKFKYKNIEVIYNPILISSELKKKKRFFFENKKFFFYLAANEKHKNINTIIKAFKNREIMSKFNLVIAGYKHEKENLFPNIFLLGKIDEDLKAYLFKRCVCYLHPSIYEGFGMPLVEALKYKKKIITTNGGSIREITSNMAIYIKNPKNFSNWVKIISKFNSMKFPRIDIMKIEKKYNYKNTLKKYKIKILNEKK